MAKIGAVLPLKASGSYKLDDLNRTDILFTSLLKFGGHKLIAPIFVVVPNDEAVLIKDHMSKWPQFDIRVITEHEVAPKLESYEAMRGWRKQQIIKIAIANFMPTKFYLTFDADVVCLKPISFDQLIINDKALIQYEQRAKHPKWWKSSSRLLKMSSDIGDNQVGMTVTPAILACDLSKNLMQDIEQERGKHWIDVLGELHKPTDPRNWKLSRILMLKWTEYSLYYLCAMKHSLLDRYHVKAGTTVNPQKLLVHESHPYENWDLNYSFSHKCPGLFCVVGSKTGLAPTTVFQRLQGYIT